MPWRSTESLNSHHDTRDSSMDHPRTSHSSRRSSIASVFRRRSSASSITSSIKSFWRPVSTAVTSHLHPESATSVHPLPTHLPPPHGGITFNTNSFGPPDSPTEEKRYRHIPSHAASDHVKQTRTPSLSHATRAPSLSEARRNSLAPLYCTNGGIFDGSMPGQRSASVGAMGSGRMNPKAARAPSCAAVSEDGL